MTAGDCLSSTVLDAELDEISVQDLLIKARERVGLEIDSSVGSSPPDNTNDFFRSYHQRKFSNGAFCGRKKENLLRDIKNVNEHNGGKSNEFADQMDDVLTQLSVTEESYKLKLQRRNDKISMLEATLLSMRSMNEVDEQQNDGNCIPVSVEKLMYWKTQESRVLELEDQVEEFEHQMSAIKAVNSKLHSKLMKTSKPYAMDMNPLKNIFRQKEEECEDLIDRSMIWTSIKNLKNQINLESSDIVQSSHDEIQKNEGEKSSTIQWC